MLADWRDPYELSGSRQRTMHQCHMGAGRHPQGRNAVEQPRRARLDATVGGFAPQGNVKYRFWYLTFHSRSSRGDPPLNVRTRKLSDACALNFVPATMKAARHHVGRHG
jgi:hypothetical protein